MTMKKKKTQGKVNIAEVLLTEAKLSLTGLYLLVMFFLFPLCLGDHYWEIGFGKWRVYLYATLIYIGVMTLLLMPGWFGKIKNRSLMRPGALEMTLLLYIISATVTFLFTTINRRAAWMGAEGWYMGFLAQLLLVLGCLLLMQAPIGVKWLLGCHAVGFTICLIIGILQRLGYDIFHLYYGMPDVVVSDFLSTIGNRTWMSGYVCAVMPVGVYFYWIARERKTRILWGSFTGLTFMGLVATYSDSAYVGLAAMLFCLFIISRREVEKLFAYGKVLVILFTSSLLMIGIRVVCGGRLMREPRGLTYIFYDWKWMVLGLTLALLFLVGVKFLKEKMIPVCGGILWLICVIAGCGILFFIGNATGLLDKWFHLKVVNKYLYFDDEWGDMRGWIWKLSGEMFGGLPFGQKLFGVGADCYGLYGYSHEPYASRLAIIWGDTVVLNAHNEWLNMLICQGFLGCLSYLAIFIVSARQFLKSKAHPLVPAVGLGVISYMVHNFFCYQQICATGILFILIGVAAALDKKIKEEIR